MFVNDGGKASPKASHAGTPRELLGYMHWPDVSVWSWHFLRVVGSAPAGGSDFAECERALTNVKADDVQGWFDAWHGLAQRLDERAQQADDAGHVTSAARKWLRAANYYRAAGWPRALDPELREQARASRVRCFQAYAARADHEMVPVEIPYEGTSLPGYLVHPTSRWPRPTPALVVCGGGDAFSEEMYLGIGRTMVDRGYTVLAFDAPGQGEALRRGIVGRHDFEVAAAACIDFLLSQGEVDEDRLAFMGESLGGYWAARAAAFEPRIKACVDNGGPYAFPMSLVLDADHNSEQMRNTLLTMTGSSTLEETREKLLKWTLDGVAEKIQCPLLYLLGAGEVASFRPADAVHDTMQAYNEVALRLYNEIPHDSKRIIFYEAGEPGSTHCQHDSLVQSQDDIGDWLDETFELRSTRAAPPS